MILYGFLQWFNHLAHVVQCPVMYTWSRPHIVSRIACILVFSWLIVIKLTFLLLLFLLLVCFPYIEETEVAYAIFLPSVCLCVSLCAASCPPESASELHRPSDRRFSAKLAPTFENRRSHVVSVTDPYGRILDFLNRSRYFLFQVAPQLYSRGCLYAHLPPTNYECLNKYLWNMVCVSRHPFPCQRRTLYSPSMNSTNITALDCSG
jgi:hypothetical protein